MHNNQITREIDSTFFNLLYPLVTESIHKKRVLLVEADIDIAATLETIFAEDKDIELQVARDTDEAMIHMIQNKFDLVVLEDHHHSPTLNHTGYIYKSKDSQSIVREIRRYFSSH